MADSQTGRQLSLNLLPVKLLINPIGITKQDTRNRIAKAPVTPTIPALFLLEIKSNEQLDFDQ